MFLALIRDRPNFEPCSKALKIFTKFKSSHNFLGVRFLAFSVKENVECVARYNKSNAVTQTKQKNREHIKELCLLIILFRDGPRPFQIIVPWKLEASLKDL